MDSEDDTRTPLHRLLDRLITEGNHATSLYAFVYTRRSQGWAWNRIALSINILTHETVTTATLIDWFGADEAMVAAHNAARSAL
ncbi:MAG: hypothetical protein GY929_27525 [Actinomycetia bacterium]|nr:hypothetical protein [Actinomycetes bacterium]